MGWRMIGGLLLGLLAAAIGFRLAARQEKKMGAYWYLRQNLELLRSGIQNGAPLAEALNACSAGGSLLWQRMAGRLEERRSESLEEIWLQELEREGNPWDLTAEESTQLQSLGQVLGRQDKEQCCRQIQSLQSFLAGREMERTHKQQERSLLYRKLGMLSGILITILLI